MKKLNENRKMLLQQKLGGGGKLKKWENIDQVRRCFELSSLIYTKNGVIMSLIIKIEHFFRNLTVHQQRSPKRRLPMRIGKLNNLT